MITHHRIRLPRAHPSLVILVFAGILFVFGNAVYLHYQAGRSRPLNGVAGEFSEQGAQEETWESEAALLSIFRSQLGVGSSPIILDVSADHADGGFTPVIKVKSSAWARCPDDKRQALVRSWNNAWYSLGSSSCDSRVRVCDDNGVPRSGASDTGARARPSHLK